jgi:hypothetical protein
MTAIIDKPCNTAFAQTVRDQAGQVLQRHYPGYLWAVMASEETGMLDILNINLSGQYGYRLKIPLIYSATSFEKDVLIGGGEILERFGLGARGMNEAKLAGLPTDFAGRTPFQT